MIPLNLTTLCLRKPRKATLAPQELLPLSKQETITGGTPSLNPEERAPSSLTTGHTGFAVHGYAHSVTPSLSNHTSCHIHTDFLVSLALHF